MENIFKKANLKEWNVFDWHAAYVRFAMTSFTQPLSPDFTAPTEPGVSNLGDLNRYIEIKYDDDVEVLDV